MTLPHKVIKIYEYLLTVNKPCTIAEMANALNMKATAIYRHIHWLKRVGFVIELNTYPKSYRANSISDAEALFLTEQRKWFRDRFASLGESEVDLDVSNQKQADEISWSFIQSRDALMDVSVEEINRSQKRIDLLRSGHEIPKHVMEALHNAHLRGVEIRMLVQTSSPEQEEEFEVWRKNGIQVRTTRFHSMRLMLFDAKVLYFMSYKHEDSVRDVGMKIDYEPFAQQLAGLFDEWWEAGVEANF